MLTLLDLTNVVNAIWRTEGSSRTKHPYGVMFQYRDTSPRQACANTVQHAALDYHVVKVDRFFIYYLSERYCPTSVDKIGNERWRSNMVRILNL